MVKEGILFVVIPFVLGLFILLLKIPFWSFFVSIALYILAGYFAFFFRDPHRVVDPGPREIVSPVDGTVLGVVDEGDTNRLNIFLSVFDVHITRMPYAGKLDKADYNKGKFLPAWRDKASELNEQIRLDITGKDLVFSLKLIAGIAARRIRMWVREGDTLPAGEKLGILMFGSRAELIFPKSVDIQVKKGDKVVGGITLIGKIQKSK